MPWIARGELQLEEVCARFAGDEMRVCVEGAMERMARYHRDRATKVCSQLADAPRRVCEEALRNELYSMDKDFEPYLEPQTER
jgi:GGDEF domain-containing protein